MNNWIKSSGKVIYDPFRKDHKKTHKVRYVILEPKLDDMIDYYHAFLEKEYGSFYKLQRPVYKPHVTIIDPKDKVQNQENWKYNDGLILDFEYNVNLKRYWKFWYLDVKSKNLSQIRKQFGLNENYNFHLTIGRELDWQEPLKRF